MSDQPEVTAELMRARTAAREALIRAIARTTIRQIEQYLQEVAR